MLTLIAFILVLTSVVLPHEIGHFIFAVRAGIRPLEMGLGFGPKLLTFKKGKTLYSLNAIPLGGFIRIAGLNPEEEKEGEATYPKEESFLSKGPLDKALTILGGPLMNFLFAFLLLSFIFGAFGSPEISNEVGSLLKGGVAEGAGLKVGDKVVSLNGAPVTRMADAIEVIHNSPGRALSLRVKRAGKTLVIKATPKYDENLKMGLIGFSPKVIYKRHGAFSAVWLGAKETVSLSLLIIFFIGQLIIGAVSFSGLAGPVGIAQLTGQAAHSGIASFLSFAAFLSINLGVVNLLPLPALDGGRVIFIIIEAIRGKPLPQEIENRIHFVGFALLMGLAAALTVNDVLRWVSGR